MADALGAGGWPGGLFVFVLSCVPFARQKAAQVWRAGREKMSERDNDNDVAAAARASHLERECK